MVAKLKHDSFETLFDAARHWGVIVQGLSHACCGESC